MVTAGLALRLGDAPPYSAWEGDIWRLLNSKNFVTSEALAEVCALLSAVLVVDVAAELVVGHSFKTQPNPKFLDSTHKSLHPTQPNPTHHRHLVWHIRLYRKLYTTTVTRHREVHSSQLE